MFGDILKQLRLSNKMTQSHLAEKLRISSSTIGMYEQNRRSPDMETLDKIAELFNVSTDYLLGRPNSIDNKKILSSVSDDSVLLEFTRTLMERKSMQLLFEQVKSLPDADILKIIKIIKAIEDDEQNGSEEN